MGLTEYLKMTTHNLSSDFNIQLSFKLNIEPPENMSTFNIQPSFKLNVEPPENIFNLEPKEQEENLKVKEIAIKKELEPQPKEIVNVQEQNNGLLIQILEAKKKLIEILEEQKDILFEYVPEKDLDEVQKRFDEIDKSFFQHCQKLSMIFFFYILFYTFEFLLFS